MGEYTRGDIADELTELLERYVSAYPAFRIKPIGAPGSEKRIEQENLMALEDDAQNTIARMRAINDGPELPRYQVMSWKKPLIIKTYQAGLSCRQVSEIFDVSHDTVHKIVRTK